MSDRRNIDAKAQDDAPMRQAEGTVARMPIAVVRDPVPYLDVDVITQLHGAALSADREACKKTVVAALANGVRREDMADLYIPEVARQMGDEWCSDELGFAGVTIGVSRLQAMLRELGPDWSGDKSADPAAPMIMLVVPQEVYHTLGAMVLAGQLRRRGLSVRMMLGARPHEVAERIQCTGYDAVFISSSRGETLESLRRIVEVIKNATNQPPPIVVGGTLLEVETEENVTALTGADYATVRIHEALKLCGLMMTPLKSTPAMRRG